MGIAYGISSSDRTPRIITSALDARTGSLSEPRDSLLIRRLKPSQARRGRLTRGGPVDHSNGEGL
jgi:hypothetical protein